MCTVFSLAKSCTQRFLQQSHMQQSALHTGASSKCCISPCPQVWGLPTNSFPLAAVLFPLHCVMELSWHFPKAGRCSGKESAALQFGSCYRRELREGSCYSISLRKRPLCFLLWAVAGWCCHPSASKKAVSDKTNNDAVTPSQ